MNFVVHSVREIPQREAYTVWQHSDREWGIAGHESIEDAQTMAAAKSAEYRNHQGKGVAFSVKAIPEDAVNPESVKQQQLLIRYYWDKDRR